MTQYNTLNVKLPNSQLENGSSANMKFSKTQLSKMVQSRRSFDDFLGPAGIALDA